jgi:hypothetical protein
MTPRRTTRAIATPRPSKPLTPPVRVRAVGIALDDAKRVLSGSHVVAASMDDETPPNLVVMTAEEHERLLDAADERAVMAAYDRTRGEELVPSEVVDRLLAGENPIRVWREHRGFSLDQLSAMTGRAKGFLSEIESGKKTGGVDTLRAIAVALRVDLDDVT